MYMFIMYRYCDLHAWFSFRTYIYSMQQRDMHQVIVILFKIIVLKGPLYGVWVWYERLDQKVNWTDWVDCPFRSNQWPSTDFLLGAINGPLLTHSMLFFPYTYNCV